MSESENSRLTNQHAEQKSSVSSKKVLELIKEQNKSSNMYISIYFSEPKTKNTHRITATFD